MVIQTFLKVASCRFNCPFKNVDVPDDFRSFYHFLLLKSVWVCVVCFQLFQVADSRLLCFVMLFLVQKPVRWNVVSKAFFEFHR
jgi:hypothetical protein